MLVNSGQFIATTDNTVLPITVANSATNVLIGKFIFKATGEAVKVETLTAGFVTNGAATALRNGKIFINGVQAGSTTNLAVAAGSPLVGGTSYTVNYTFQPGVSTPVEIYADISAATGTLSVGNLISAALLLGSGNGTPQTSLSTIAVPTADMQAASVQVGAGAATLALTSNFTAKTTVAPQTAYQIGSWIVTAGTAENININNLLFDIPTLAAFDSGDMANMYVTYQVGSAAPVTTSIKPTVAAANNFPVSFAVGMTQSVQIDLYTDILNTATAATNYATLTVSANGATSGTGVTFTPASLNGQNITIGSSSLVVAQDPSTPVATLTAANQTITSASFKFTATNDTYTLPQLVFSLTNASAVSQVNLMDGTTLIQSRPGAATVTFNGFAATPSVSANTTKILTVQLVLGGVGTGAGTSGSNALTTFVAASSLVRPSATGTAAYLTQSNAAGNNMYVYASVPTIVAGSGLPLPTGTLTVGTNTIAKFSVGTNGTGTVAWRKITFTAVKTAGPTIANTGAVTLWNADTNTQITGYGVATGLTGGAGSGSITFYPTVEEQVSGTRNYVLKATVGGAAASTDYINTSIAQPSTTTVPGTFASLIGSPSYFDADGSATVTAGDTRLVAADSYAAATFDATSTTDVSTGVIVESKFLRTGGALGGTTVTFTYTAGTTTWASAGWTVPATDATGFVATHTATGQILTVSGLGAGDGETAVVNIGAKTVGGYTANSIVATGQTDLGLAIAALPNGSGASFVWSDVSAQSHSIITGDWTTDFLVKTLPTDTQNLRGQ
jgi:hypothetical protein